jgi:hypothetical protein
MKASFLLRQKLKLAALLAAIMVCILIANLIVKYNLQKIDQTFTSIYKDRLIPGRDLFYASENIHSRAMLMDKYFKDNIHQDVANLEKEINISNLKLDSLINKYEKTFLIKEEEETLQVLKQKIEIIRICEQRILSGIESGAETGKAIYENAEIPLIHEAINYLHQLANIQAKVGQDLFQETQGEIKANSSISTIEIVMVIIIGLIANGLILGSKLVIQKEQKFHLN